MTRRTLLSKEASAGVKRIAGYIARQTGSARRAELYLIHVNRALHEIALFSGRYPVYDIRFMPEVRRKVLDNLTIILYRVEGQTIKVINIHDARTDWQ